MTAKSYVKEEKPRTSVPIFSRLTSKETIQRVLKRRDEIRSQYYESIATKVIEGLL